MGEVIPWSNPAGIVKSSPPKRQKRPCDYGLEIAVLNLETQLGTIEAYNRLVDAANSLKSRIDSGDVKSQNPLYAVSIKG